MSEYDIQTQYDTQFTYPRSAVTVLFISVAILILFDPISLNSSHSHSTGEPPADFRKAQRGAIPNAGKI